MSSHTHLALVAGAEPFWRLAKALNTAVGGYLNQSQGRSGPVFEGRPFTSVIEGVHAARLVRYLHNNPVRARKCAEARECSWTSHRAYLGLRGDSAALNVTAGLDLCGFGGSTAGRSHFDEHVLAHGADGRDPLLTGDGVHDRRLRVRKALGAAAELSSPQVVDGRVVQAILVPKEGRLRLEWEGSLEPILEAACDEVGTSPELARTSRTAAAGFARSVFLWAAHRDMRMSPPPPWNGRRAVRPTYSITPTAYQSLAGDNGCRAACSGDMPDGGTVRVQTSLGPGATHVVVGFTDEGPGIDEADHSRVFDPFYTTKGEGKGTGLGLAVVKHLVGQAGGTITLEDGDDGVGACFKVMPEPTAPGSEPPWPGSMAIS